MKKILLFALFIQFLPRHSNACEGVLAHLKDGLNTWTESFFKSEHENLELRAVQIGKAADSLRTTPPELWNLEFSRLVSAGDITDREAYALTMINIAQHRGALVTAISDVQKLSGRQGATDMVTPFLDSVFENLKNGMVIRRASDKHTAVRMHLQALIRELTLDQRIVEGNPSTSVTALPEILNLLQILANWMDEGAHFQALPLPTDVFRHLANIAAIERTKIRCRKADGEFICKAFQQEFPCKPPVGFEVLARPQAQCNAWSLQLSAGLKAEHDQVVQTLETWSRILSEVSKNN